MDSGRSPIFAGGLKQPSDNVIKKEGALGTRRRAGSIRWYEYTFLLLGILAALATDGLTIARLIKLRSLHEPDFAYGILILVHSVFLLLFLITGILYQRTSDIIAFFISAVLLTVYVIAHYFARRTGPATEDTQPKLRLARLILTVSFNVCFIPLVIIVIKDYQREEFSKRLFGAFPAARWPFKIYTVFDCVARISTMLSLSTLLLNLYNDTRSEILDRILLGVGIPVALLWLGFGIGMVRLESRALVCLFYFFSLYQIGFLIYSLVTAIKYSVELSHASTTTTTTTRSSSTQTPVASLVPVLQVLYVCMSTNLLAHILSMVFGFLCIRNFGGRLKETVFNNKVDKWFQERWFEK